MTGDDDDDGNGDDQKQEIPPRHLQDHFMFCSCLLNAVNCRSPLFRPKRLTEKVRKSRPENFVIKVHKSYKFIELSVQFIEIHCSFGGKFKIIARGRSPGFPVFRRYDFVSQINWQPIGKLLNIINMVYNTDNYVPVCWYIYA